MAKYNFNYQHEAGMVRGVVFQIGVRAEPDLHNVLSFAVILFIPKEDGSIVEVAKVDNAEHDEGTIHIDRYYREVGADVKNFEIDVDSVWEADKYIEDHWDQFARKYLENHGVEPREG